MHNFVVFKLWSTEFLWLIGWFKAFPQLPKDVNQSSPVWRKSGPKFKIWHF